MRDQWLSMNEYKLASEYAIKAETITELLENVVVFNVGDGLRAFSQPIAKRLTVDERINSFKEILK